MNAFADALSVNQHTHLHCSTHVQAMAECSRHRRASLLYSILIPFTEVAQITTARFFRAFFFLFVFLCIQRGSFSRGALLFRNRKNIKCILSQKRFFSWKKDGKKKIAWVVNEQEGERG
jgi:hypothetical protein